LDIAYLYSLFYYWSRRMYVVNPMPAPIDAKLLEALRQTDVGTIGHFLDTGFMDPGISAKMPRASIVGTAVTVRVTVPDSVITHYALGQIRANDILVIDRGQDQRTACLGGSSSAAAAKAGLAGVIMDGVGNDISQACAVGLPIWCRGVTPLTTKYRDLGGEFNVTISCGGVSVAPGDIIMADENGVLVIPMAEGWHVAERAVEFGQRERAFLETLAARPSLSFPDETGATEIVRKSLAGVSPRPPSGHD
jgi:4-hydroxy-4-methyl-2-oxoglutarate aldolase